MKRVVVGIEFDSVETDTSVEMFNVVVKGHGIEDGEECGVSMGDLTAALCTLVEKITERMPGHAIMLLFDRLVHAVASRGGIGGESDEDEGV